jgi:hypothetical protein
MGPLVVFAGSIVLPWKLSPPCEKVRVALYCHAQRVAEAEGAFAAPKTYLDLNLRADCVTHLRVEVLSYFKMGGGLAEIDVN